MVVGSPRAALMPRIHDREFTPCTTRRRKRSLSGTLPHLARMASLSVFAYTARKPSMLAGFAIKFRLHGLTRGPAPPQGR